MSRVEHLAEGVTLYCGDCREILPGLGPVDAVVTDPPYGLGEKMQGGTWGAKTGFKSMLDWDRAPPPPDLLAHLIGRARESLLWGGAILSSAAGALLADLEQDQRGADHG